MSSTMVPRWLWGMHFFWRREARKQLSISKITALNSLSIAMCTPAYFMLRKGISKAKLLSDLIMMKRGKIAGKAAMHNLIFHHHHHHQSAAAEEPQLSYPVPPNEYEFSCRSRSTPAYPTFRLPFHLSKRKHAVTAQPSESELWTAAVEMASSVAPSPALPGFGRTPMVRQLRITDSPVPLREIEEDNRVDEAAEKFITKFYRD